MQSCNSSHLFLKNRVCLHSLTALAKSWWCNLMRNGNSLSNWNEFKQVIDSEFVPKHQQDIARDSPRSIHQKNTVSKYLADFHNLVLFAVGEIHEAKKKDRCISELKRNIQYEVMRADINNFTDVTRVALKINAIKGRDIPNINPDMAFSEISQDDPFGEPMEIGIIQ